MSFGRKSGDVRNYQYGVPHTVVHKGLLTGTDEAVREMRRRVRLWNRLVELDREIQAKRDVILAPYPRPEKGRRVLPVEVKQALIDLEESYREPVNRACRESGCYSCNYTEVKIAWQAARKRPGEVRFHRWGGDGRSIVYLARGLPVAEAWGDNRKLRLRDGDREGDVVVWLRVQSDEEHHPVWLTLPIRMHRPLPPDGLIKSVAVNRWFVATEERWSVVFCVERAGGWRTHGPGHGRVAIDIGWRRVPEGLRAATWRDESETGTLILPEEPFLWAMRKCDDLRSIRDRLWNETIAALRAWRDEHKRLPDWLAEELRHIHLWQRKSRLVVLHARWEQRRFKGDQIGFAIVDTWLERDTHLWEWEANLRDQTLADRRERYRVWAAGLAQRYGEIVLEDFDLSRVAVVKNGGAGGELWEAARRQRQWAGVYQLRQCIESAAKREGVVVTKQAAAYSTLVCSRCGSLERWDTARELRHRCEACGAEWDQDESAALNLLSGEHSYTPALELAGAR